MLDIVWPAFEDNEEPCMLAIVWPAFIPDHQMKYNMMSHVAIVWLALDDFDELHGHY